jgi:hypothetical protein
MNDREIVNKIRILLEGGNIPKDVAKGLDGAATSAKHAQTEFKKTSESTKELGKLVRDYLGAAAVGEFLKSSVELFAKIERAFNATRIQMKNLGLDATTDLPKVRKELEAIALSGGSLLSETLPAFQKFIGITKSTSTALGAVTLAANIAEDGTHSFGEAQAAVAAIVQGKAKIAAQQLGIELVTLNGHHKTGAEILDEVIKKYGGLADGLHDTENAMQASNAQWEQLKELVGKELAPAFRVLPEILFHIVGGVKDLGAYWGFVVNMILTGARNAGDVLGAAFDFKKLISSPGEYLAAVKSAYMRVAEESKQNGEVLLEQIKENHTRETAAEVDHAGDLKNLRKQAARATAEEDNKVAAEAARKRAEIEEKALEESLQAQIQGAAEGSAERLALEMRLLDAQEAFAIANAQREGASVEKVRDSFRAQRVAKDAEYLRKQAEADEAAQVRLATAQRDATVDGTNARLEAELALMDAAFQKELDRFKGSEAAKTQLEEAFQLERQKLIDQYDMSEVEKELARHTELLDAKRTLDEAIFALEEQDAGDQGLALSAIKLAHLELLHSDELASLKAAEQAEIDASDKTDAAIAAIHEKYNKLKLASDVRYTQAKKKLSLDDVHTQVEAGLEISQAAVGFAAATFGQTKAIKKAEAYVNLAAGIVNIWSKWGDIPWVAGILTALLSATAFAQIQAIDSASIGGGSSAGGGTGGGMPTVPERPQQAAAPASENANTSSNASGAAAGITQKTTGRGFDDPGNDQLAAMGGRRWASDFVRMTGDGFAAGIKEAYSKPDQSPIAQIAKAIEGLGRASNGPVTVAAEGGGGLTIIVKGNVYGGDEGMRQLSRELSRASRLDSNRLVK